MEPKATQIRSRSRAVRVAYFVPLDEGTHPILDAIFTESFQHWGGRFSLVVPCTSGAPLPAFEPWLRAFDADVIYSYVDLADEQIAYLHEALYPAELRCHGQVVGPGEPRYRPSLPLGPLWVGSVLPTVALPSLRHPTAGIRLISALGDSAHERFFTDSFGRDYLVRNQLDGRMAQFGTSITLLEPQERDHHRAFIRPMDHLVPSLSELLIQTANRLRDLSMSQLSATACGRLEVDHGEWGDSFNLVIGDTVEDRLLYWNMRAFAPAWRDGADLDLCVPSALMTNETFVHALSTFLRYRNMVTPRHNQSGPPRTALHSTSLSQEALSAYIPALRSVAKHHVIVAAPTKALLDSIPASTVFDQARMSFGQIGLRLPTAWTEHYATGTELRFAAPTPEHLRLLPPAQLHEGVGLWAVDLDIERTVDHSPLVNYCHRWRLPRRLRVTGAFVQPYELHPPHGPMVNPRVQQDGLLSVFTTVDVALPVITLPTDHNAIRWGFTHGRNWHATQHQDQQPPEQLCYAVERSDAGQHFFGVYQMFGDLKAASGFLLHRFWRTQLAHLRATDQRADERYEAVLNQVGRRLGGHSLDLADPIQQATLANLILQSADAERLTETSRSWDALRKDFEHIGAEYVARHNDHPLTDEELSFEKRSQLGELKAKTQWLCERGVLYQGFDLKCSRCLHRNWVALDALHTVMTCQVCRSSIAAPVDRPWQFRLNGFLRESLRSHGIGPIFWVLHCYLQAHRTGSFWFEGPLNIFFDYQSFDRGQPATDVDLTMVVNGQVIMCEAKQSGRALTRPVDFAETIKRLRPDVGVIAIMEPVTQVIHDKYERFAQALAGTGIRPFLLTLDPDAHLFDEPYFLN